MVAYSRRRWAIRYVNTIWALAVIASVLLLLVGFVGPLVIPDLLILPVVIAAVLTIIPIAILVPRMGLMLILATCAQVVIAHAVFRLAAIPAAARASPIMPLWIVGIVLPFVMAGGVFVAMARVPLHASGAGHRVTRS